MFKFWWFFLEKFNGQIFEMVIHVLPLRGQDLKDPQTRTNFPTSSITCKKENLTSPLSFLCTKLWSMKKKHVFSCSSRLAKTNYWSLYNLVAPIHVVSVKFMQSRCLRFKGYELYSLVLTLPLQRKPGNQIAKCQKGLTTSFVSFWTLAETTKTS